MKMAPLDIVDGSYADEDKSFSAQDTVNYLPASAEQGGSRTPSILKTPPGLKPAVLIGVNDGEVMTVAGAVRNTYNAEGRMFAVAGNQLFQITPSGVSIPLGTVPGVNRVTFAHNQITNGNEVLITNGNSGYIYNTVTQVFQRITDTSYPGGLGGVFINNRFVQIEPARRYAFNSALADGLSYNALDRFTSETSPDLLMSLQSIGNQLAVFSTTTTEWFEDTGANPQPFRSTGIVADKGAAGPFATAKLDNQLFFLADDGVFYRYQGYNPVRISTKPIEQAIRGLNWFNVFTTTWEDSGYSVCYWTFPDGQTWGYDASSGKWHRRESYGFNRWRANSLTFWRNAWYAGDFQNGRLWQLDWDYILEGDEEIEGIRAAGVVADNQNRVIHERLEVIMDTGMVETVPIAFEDQPEGPTISGDAPNGNQAIAWGPYSYTAADGTPPYRFSLRPGGTLPPGIGPLSPTGVIAAGTPTAQGQYTFTVRVTDANGLYADLEDTILIADVILISGSQVTVGEPFAAYYTENAWVTIPAATMTLSTATCAAGDNHYVIASNLSTRYSSTLASWNTGTMPGGTGTLIGMAYGASIFGACGASGTIVRSADFGATFTQVTSPHAGNYQCIAYGDGRWIIGGGSNENDVFSDDNLTTVTEISPQLFAYQTTGLATDGNGLWHAAGGTSTPTDPGQIKVSTDNGDSWSVSLVTTPSLPVELAMGNGRAVCLCHQGEILFTDDDWDNFGTSAFVLSDPGFGYKLAHNGAVFLLTVDNGFSEAQSYVSEDGDTWTGPTDTGLAGVNGIAVNRIS